MRHHPGQISFPGGRFEDGDLNLIDTAKRECFEEVGVEASKVKVLGTLSKLYIPVSNYMVQPVVAYIACEPNFVLQRSEVQRVVVLPFEEVFAPTSKSVATLKIKDSQLTVPVYQIDDCMIWGATAMIFSELEVVFEEIGLLERSVK